MSPGIINKFNESLQLENVHKIDDDMMNEKDGSRNGNGLRIVTSKSDGYDTDDQGYDYNEDDSQIFERCVQDLGFDDEDTSESKNEANRESTNKVTSEVNGHTSSTIDNTSTAHNNSGNSGNSGNRGSGSISSSSTSSSSSNSNSNTQAKQKADKIHRRRSNANQMMLQLSRSNSNTNTNGGSVSSSGNGYGHGSFFANSSSTPSSSATSFKSCSQFAAGNNTGSGFSVSPTLPQVAHALSRQRSSSLANSPSSIPTHLCCLERYVQQDLDSLAMSDASSTKTSTSTKSPSTEHSNDSDTMTKLNAYKLGKSRTSNDLDVTPVAVPGNPSVSTNPFYTGARSPSRSTPIAHSNWDTLNTSDEQLCESTFAFINNSRQGSKRPNYYFDKLENYAGLGNNKHTHSTEGHEENENSAIQESDGVSAEAMRPRMTRRVSLMTMALSESLPPLGRHNTAPNGMYEHS